MTNEKKTIEFPKRRKANDNPYTLGFNEDTQQYTVTFKDNFGEKQVITISEKLYLSFDQFELDDLKFLNQYDRHIEHSQQTELQLHFRTKNIIEDDFILLEKKFESEKLKRMIKQLPKVQCRRLKLYFFEGLNYEQIAKFENCSYQAISYSINIAIKNLKKIYFKT